MAKTMKRPVDKLERQQRLAQQTHRSKQNERWTTMGWQPENDDEADQTEDDSVDQDTDLA